MDLVRDDHNPASDPRWYRYIFDAIPDAILLIDHRGNYVDANQAATDFLGYSHEEFLDLHISAIATRAPTDVLKRLETLIEEGGIADQSVFRRKDGAVVTASARVIELITPTATYYMGIFQPTEQQAG